MAAGRYHSLALTYGGNVYAWGGNSEYQLGVGSLGTDSNGTELNSDTPVKVKGPGGTGSLTDVVAIAAGYDFNLALKSDGTVWSWGGNGHGQLGVNSNNRHGYPVQVHGTGNVGYLSGITAIAAGERHALAVKNDGTVYSWGGNNHGQLGVHSDNQHQYPVQVHGLNNVGYLSGITDVDAGEFFSMALNSAGTAVYAWGGNSYGQIDATTQDHSYPVQVQATAGSTPPDTTAPRTKINKHPPRVVNATGRKAKAKFTFTSSERGSTFACKLDKRAWRRCESPETYRVNGRHTFKVRATDSSGNTDPTPARWRWKVKHR